MGNSKVKIMNNNNILQINEKKYDITPGLMNLIMTLKSDSKLYIMKVI